MFINPHINNYDDNGVYQFPGTGESYIEVGNQSILNVLGTGQFTLSIFFNPSNATDRSALFSAWLATSNNRVIQFRTDTSGNFEVITSPDGTNAARWEASHGMSNGNWYHAVAVADFTQTSRHDRIKIYLNAVDLSAVENLDASDAGGVNTGDYTTDGALFTIGGVQGSTTFTSNGSIQVPSIINRPLSSSEVSELYNSGKPLNTIVRFGDDCVLQPTLSTAILVAANELEVMDNATEQRYSFAGELESRLDRNGGLYDQ